MQGRLWMNSCTLCGAHSSAAGPWECVFISFFFPFNSESVKKKEFILSVIGKQKDLVPFKSVLQPQFAVLMSLILLLQFNLEELVQNPSWTICSWGVGFGSSQLLESTFSFHGKCFNQTGITTKTMAMLLIPLPLQMTLKRKAVSSFQFFQRALISSALRRGL